jgi:N-acetylmuramoyl-L-alanine amidase
MEDSIRLAHHLQGSMVTRVGQKYGGTVDLGVKKALFHVLVGARMPSVLVEVSFITNRIEGRNLTTPAYQETVVNALYEGIERYRASAFAARNL